MLPVAAPEVIVKSLPDGAVLYHPGQEVYYGLNQVGEQIWNLLPPASRSVEEICARLTESYPDVDPDVLRRDVGDIIDDLLANGLVLAAGARTDADERSGASA